MVDEPSRAKSEHIVPQDVSYTNDSCSFTVSLHLDDEGIFHMKKVGYQDLADVPGEQTMVEQFLSDCSWLENKYLCVDASDFKGQSRLTRKKHAEFIKTMPFEATVAYGLSQPVRVLAAVFVRFTQNKPIRIFKTRAEAMDYIRADRAQNGFISPKVDTLRSQDTLQAVREIKPAIWHQYSECRGTAEYNGRSYDTLHLPHWRFENAAHSFRSKHTLIGTDIILTESSGSLTEEVVRETQMFSRSVMAEVSLDPLYFVHDSRSVNRIDRRTRAAIRLRYESELERQILCVVVGKPLHVIAMRWLRLVAPTIFDSWIPAPSVEKALGIIEAHRQEYRSGENKVPKSFIDRNLLSNEDQWIPTNQAELIALVKKQRASLIANERALGLVVDQLGRLSWDEFAVEQYEEDELEPKFDLVFGALRLMHSDIAEILGELNQRMDELSQSKKQLSVAQTIAHLGSWEWVLETNAISWSDETYRIFGYEPKSTPVSYDLFLNHQHPSTRPEVEEFIRATIEDDAPFEHTQRLVRLDGSERVLHARGYLERDANAGPVRMYGTVHDVTDLVAARAAEQTAYKEMGEREASLRDTLMDLSHDVRTPLASLKLGIGRLSDTDIKPGLLSSLIAEVEYLDGLFANIMSLVRIKSSKIELNKVAVGVNDVLERVTARLSILAMERSVAVECSGPDDELQVFGDPLALEQAIGNLVHNAIKFAGGNVAVLLDQADNVVVFQVRDDGPGLLDIEIPRLTDRYYRGLDKGNRAGRGQGLGLPIAKAIIEEHSGTLVLGRLESGGTVVTVRLPILEGDGGKA